MAGVFQVFIQIVGPVWVDKFYKESNQKTTLMTILIGSAPFGLTAGYAIAAVTI